MADAVRQPMRVESEVVCAGQARQQPSGVMRRILREDSESASDCANYPSSIRPLMRAAL